MKKIFVTLILVLTTSAFAQHNDNHNHYHRNHNMEWVLPAIVTGAIVYQATRPPVVIQQPPVVYSGGVPVYQQQTCTPWIEIQNIDGSITRQRTCR